MFTKLQRLAILALLTLGLLPLPLVASAQAGMTFFVTDVDASKFPDVQFKLRAVDLNNQVVPNLNSTNLSIYENGQLVPNAQVAPNTDAPINIAFVVDLGRQSNFRSFGLNNIRLAITTLVTGGYFVDGLDTVQVLGRQNTNSDQTQGLLPVTQSGAELTNWAANFNFQAGSNPTKGLLGVEDAITALSTQVPIVGSQATAIIFISRRIEDPITSVAVSAAQSLAQKAKQQYISIYTYHIAQANDQPLRILASGATGEYVPLQRNTVATSVDSVYNLINAQRTVYIVTYRSQLGTSGTRQITINNAQAPETGATGSYDITVPAPSIQIFEPVPNSTIRREPKPSADGKTFVYETNFVTVKAEIGWPDNSNPREIKSAQLYVEGVLQDTAQPAPGDSEVQFRWDVTDLVKEGINAVKIEVRVKDELDTEAVGEATVNIEVIAPPPDKPENPLVSLFTKYWPILLIAGLGLLIVIPVTVAVFYLTKPKPEMAPAPVAEAQNTLIASPPETEGAMATLKVLEGPPGLIGETFYISKVLTLIGRNPKVAHIVFYPNEDSSVSRHHCTIQLEGKYFLLIDNNSANGTRINGELIKPDASVQLRDGDEIILGDLAKLGVKLQFNLLAETAAPKESAGLDRTFYIDTGDKDELDKQLGS